MMIEVAIRRDPHSPIKALFLGNLTIDFVGNRCRVGGSGFYGGVALSEYLGVETHVYTAVDEAHEPLMKSVLNLYGIKMWSKRCSETTTFEIDSSKACRIVKKGCRLELKELEAMLDFVKPRILLITPVAGEIELTDAISLVKGFRNNVDVISLDVQGFVRAPGNDGSISCFWPPELNELIPLVDLVHGNVSEFCLDNPLHTLTELSQSSSVTILVSLDSRGCIVIREGELVKIPAPHVNPVDEVGAGDILTSVTSYYIAMRFDPLEAAARGVVAASLKVENPYGRWFDENLLQTLSRQVLSLSKRFDDDFSLR